MLYLYSATLDKLRRLPESSVYRQATEKLTRHRLRLVETVVPPGLAEWETKLQAQMREHPAAFEGTTDGAAQQGQHDGRRFVFVTVPAVPTDDVDEKNNEWNGDPVEEEPEGLLTLEEKLAHWKNVDPDPRNERAHTKPVEVVPEPQLTSEQ